jgi:hypothetical protein
MNYLLEPRSDLVVIDNLSPPVGEAAIQRQEKYCVHWELKMMSIALQIDSLQSY